jgi:hypothetical protein
MKFLSKHTIHVAAALAGFACVVPAARAAVLSVAQANLTNASQVDSSGAYVSGVNQSGDTGSAPQVNGVTFKATQSGFVFEGPANTPGTFRYIAGSGAASGIFPSGGLGTDLNELLDSCLFGNGVVDVAVVGLNPLNTYRLQLLMADNRAGNSSSQNWLIRTGTFTGGGAGTFTPGATLSNFTVSSLGTAGTHNAEIVTITLSGESAIDIKANGGGQAFLNGMALHVVPEPTSIVLLGLAGVTLLSRRQRRTTHGG